MTCCSMKSDFILNLIKVFVSNYRWVWMSIMQCFFQVVDVEGLVWVNGNFWIWLVCFGEEKAVQAFVEHQEVLVNEYAEFSVYLDVLFSEELIIVYFSMEYGFYELFFIYLGGLGILVGDHFKEVSDFGFDLVVVGFLYSEGYLF